MVGSTHRRFPFDFNSRPFDSSPGPQTNLGLHAQEYSFPFFSLFSRIHQLAVRAHAARCDSRKGWKNGIRSRERERGYVYENIKSVGCKDCELRGFCSFASFSSTLVHGGKFTDLMVSFIISYTFGRVRKVSHFLPPPPPFRTVSVDGRRFEGCWIDGGGCCITMFEISWGKEAF